MPLKQTCFANAGKFASWTQAPSLRDRHTVLYFEGKNPIHGQTVTADPHGMCWAYCCQWIEKIKLNKHYMVKELDSLKATQVQKDLGLRFSQSNTSNALLLNLGCQQQDYGWNDIFTSAHFEQRLNAVAKPYNFIMITLEGLSWAHAIAAKLDRSLLGGWLNGSYPCAMFDPNIGQGMYKNNGDLAADMERICNEYRSTFGSLNRVRFQAIGYDKVN